MMEDSVSLKMCREYLGRKVKIIIDQPFGSTYEGAKYELNYGYVPDTIAPDGLGLDAYFLDPKEALEEAEGVCIAIIHRLEDDDDKLIISNDPTAWNDEQILKAVNFREKLFKHILVRE